MKKFKNNFAYGAAALLFGAMTFSACSSSDDVENDPNPTFDGKAVKTQFAISIPAGGQQTRVAGGTVQSGGATDFRGLSNIRLIPFSATVGTAFENDAILLADIGKTGDLNNNAKFYSDVAVPIGTTRFLFYAEATPSGADKDNGALEATNGDLTTGLLEGKNIDDFKFKHKQINSTANTNIQGYLVGILDAVVGSFNGLTDPNDVAALDNLKKTKVGSSSAIKAVMKDIYNTVSTGATAVKTEIEKYFVPSSDFAYKTDATGYVTNADNYPGYLGIPEGAAQVEFNKTASKFAYVSVNATDFATYVFPASLYYWVNSEIGAATEKQSDNWSGTTADWGTFINTNYSETSVGSSTQSIVLKSPVQYAVSQLVYNVHFNADQVLDKASHPINVVTGGNANFKLKGILIGGQKAVDYKFEQLSGETERTIYDASIGGTLQDVTTATGGKNYYSLTLQTEKRAENANEDNQKIVSIALEMVNNSGAAFTGKDNEIIPDGGTFYLRGELRTKFNNSNEYVFEQDHKTVANITIRSLASAEYTIPDLRKTELELGLYVDLEWQEGLTYDVVIE